MSGGKTMCSVTRATIRNGCHADTSLTSVKADFAITAGIDKGTPTSSTEI